MGHKRIVIIGNGITGITCAIEIRKRSQAELLVISDETDFFFSRPALMYVFLGHITEKALEPYERSFWKKHNITLKRGKAVKILTNQNFIELDNTESISYETLVLATGSRYNKFNWPGQELPGVQGFYSRSDLTLLENNAKGIERAVVVGGGLIGVEVAEMLRSRKIHVDFLVREKFFWDIVLPTEEAMLVGEHVAEHGINMRLQTEMKAIHSGTGGRVERIELTTGEFTPAGLVALTVGVSPNIELAKNSGIACERGILVNTRFETNTPNVYSAGDCAQFKVALPGRKSIEQVWYTGKTQAETLAKILCGENTEYNPGIWYNSAKFFDLEYQVYGDIPAKLPEGHDTFYWQSADKAKCLRINYNRDTRAVTGIHAIGIRLRQKAAEDWILQKIPIQNAVRQLDTVNFDPEFFHSYADEISTAYATKEKIYGR